MDEGSQTMDRLMRGFFGDRYPGAQASKPRPFVRAVTAENAHEFVQPAKRRGRPPKVRTGGNVVALRTRPQPAPVVGRATQYMREMVAAVQASREAARLARALPPAPDDPDLRRRVNTRAAGRTLADLQEHEATGQGTFNGARYAFHWNAIWRELGYEPPQMRTRVSTESAAE